LNSVYIGIDLAWGEKNLSGFCAIDASGKKLKILDIKLIKSIDEIIDEISKYKEYKTLVGVDAALVVPNESGNREIEKNFNKDFARYKISMLPANKKILSQYSPNIRSIELYEKLASLGFKRDYASDKVIFEVYTHSTVAMCFNNHEILPYKRKKGRDTAFIKNKLGIYRDYLKKEFLSHIIFKEDIESLKGQKVKDYEDMLDSITCAYCIYYCQDNDCKFYQVNGVDTLVTPISKWKVYILRCSDDTLYTGITTDLDKRLNEHNSSAKGARYTRVRRPVELIYYENRYDRVDASKREYEIKQLSRKQKLELIDSKIL
jgi:putative endonuclease